MRATMGLHHTGLAAETLQALRTDSGFPARPLALNAARRFDQVRQRALSRCYIAAGASSLAGPDARARTTRRCSPWTPR